MGGFLCQALASHQRETELAGLRHPQDGTLDSPEGRRAGESPQETCVGAWAPWTDSGGNCLLLSS